MNILVTCSNGFIGFHLVNLLTSQGHNIIGIDNISSKIKITQKIRSKILNKNKNFKFFKFDFKKKIPKKIIKNKINLKNITSVYAASKLTTEIISQVYQKLYNF